MTDEAIDVLDHVSEGLIVCDPTGSLYTNQAGGLLCLHPEARGILVEYVIPEDIKTITLNLGWNHEDCPISDEIAAACEKLLPWRLKREDSYEAWLRVRLTDDRDGILVWENSD